MWSLTNSKNTVEISPSIVVYAVALVGGLWFLFFISPILVMLFLAVILMAALNPAVRWLERKLKLNRMVGIVLVYLMVIGLIGGLLALIIPPLASELQKLNLDGYIPIESIEKELKNIKFSITEIDGLLERLNQLGNSLNTAYSVIARPISGLFTIFTTLVISIYLLSDRDNLYKKLSWFTRDPEHLVQAKNLIDSIEQQLGGWVRGQLILMFVIGVITYIGLLFLGIPYALPLAILAAFLEILPNLGPTLAAVPSVLLAIAHGGPVYGLITGLFYFIVQQMENNIIVPKIMKANADVNPLVAIVTILVGLKVGGVLGALLSIPTYIIFRSFYSLWYHHNVK